MNVTDPTHPARPTSRAFLRDAHAGMWLAFRDPIATLVARTPEEVLPILREAETRVERDRVHAVVVASYEAAPGLDDTFSVAVGSAFPLLWIGFFAGVESSRDFPADDPKSDTSAGRRWERSWEPTVSRDSYTAAVQRIRSLIGAGETYQVNYTFRLRGSAPPEPLAFMRDWVHSQRPPFGAYVELGGEWTLCSASPELFLDVREGRVSSRPMKGTARRGATLDADAALARQLAESEKDRAENVMIVDMVRSDLGRIADTGSVCVENLFAVEKYPTVWQMTSTVLATTTAPVSEIFRAAFPPASITGAPRRQTMKIISELEATPRQCYTGSIGFLAPGRRAQFNVAIRTLLIHSPTATAEYGIGGGITWDSDPAAEWEECWTKARTVLEDPVRFDLLETMLWTPEEGFILLDRHLARLAESASYFDFPAELEAIRSALLADTTRYPPAPQKVRLLLSACGALTLEHAAIGKAAPSDSPLRVAIAKTPVDPENRFLLHKTTHRVIYDEALRQWPDHDDVLLWNTRGEITESTRFNVVARIDDAFVTPPVASGLLAGTLRAQLLHEGRISERVISIDDLARATEVHLVNSVRGWRRAILDGPLPDR